MACQYPTFENEDMIENFIDNSSEDTVKRNHKKLEMQIRLANKRNCNNKVLNQIKETMRARNLNITVSSEISAINHDDERYNKMGCIRQV